MHTALFTVAFAGLWGQDRLTLEESIDLAASLGYDGVEIMGKRPHLSVLDTTLDDCRRLRDYIGERGCRVAAIAGYTDFGGAGRAIEVPSAEMQILYVGELARRSALLGCDLVRVFTSYETGTTDFMSDWRRTVEALRSCCDRAADAGVRIGVQNHHDIGVDTRAYLQLLSEVDRPNLVPMYDCWSPYLRGENVVDWAGRLAPRIAFSTVADYVVLRRWRYEPKAVNYTPVEPPAVLAVPMGEGELPYDAFFKALASHGYRGWVSYEMCSPIRGGGSLPNLTLYAKRFISYMEKFRQTALETPSH